MTDYTPIDCGLHSTYELAVMQRQPVWLTWQDRDSELRSGMVLPMDLVTRHGEEFLLVSLMNEACIEIRLDRIQRLEPAR